MVVSASASQPVLFRSKNANSSIKDNCKKIIFSRFCEEVKQCRRSFIKNSLTKQLYFRAREISGRRKVTLRGSVYFKVLLRSWLRPRVISRTAEIKTLLYFNPRRCCKNSRKSCILKLFKETKIIVVCVWKIIFCKLLKN